MIIWDLVDNMMDDLESTPRPITPARLRRVVMNTCGNDNDVLDRLSGRPSFSSLETASAEFLNSQTEDIDTLFALAAGEFLHIVIPLIHREKRMYNIKKAWENPNECKFCYRITTSSMCSSHDSKLNVAEYHRGRRIKPTFDSMWNNEKQLRKAIPDIPIAPLPLASWMTKYCPNIELPETNFDLLAIIERVDDHSTNPLENKLRNSEHCIMCGLYSDKHPLNCNALEQTLRRPPQPFSNNFAKIFLLKADCWERASASRKHGGKRPGSGGQRPGAGRPKNKAGKISGDTLVTF